ncbi:MAG TPA: M48 family metalloprotease [Gammaproteobacteria bacterium]
MHLSLTRIISSWGAALLLLAAGNAHADLFGGLSKALQESGNSKAAKIGSVLNTSKSAFGEVSEEQERDIGRQAAAVLFGAAPPLDNDALQRYVNRVGNWVALQGERPRLQWRFAVLDDNDVNAFAAPGGYVFITKGLLLTMQSEAELAGVLSHETVHVLRKHHLAAVQKGARLDLAGLAAGQAVKNDQNRAQLEKLTGGFKELYSRGLDKEDEFEADRMGIVIATRAGYDPYGLPAVLQTLGAMNPQDGALAFMFKTHPAPALRLERLAPLLTKLEPYAAQPAVGGRFAEQLATLKK